MVFLRGGRTGGPTSLQNAWQPNEKEASYLRRTFVSIKIRVPSFFIQRTFVFENRRTSVFTMPCGEAQEGWAQ